MPTRDRDEFAESLARSLRRRARPDRPSSALLPARERRRALLAATLVVVAFFALVYLAAVLATACPIH